MSGAEAKGPRRVVYIAGTDIPSRMANSIQVMKNADAWAGVCERFELYTCTSVGKRLSLNRDHLREFYGLSHDFQVHAYPLARLLRSRVASLREVYYRLALRAILADPPDLIFTRSYLVPPLLPQGSPPTVVETHSPPDDSLDKRRLFDAVRAGRVAALVTISEPLKRMYVEEGLDPARIAVLPDGFDPAQYAEPMPREQAAARIGLPADRPIVGYVGHLYDGRGVDTILHAAARVPEALFVLVGGHDRDVERRRLEASALGLSNVRFTGFVPNARVPEHLWACDALLMPYGRDCPTADWMSPLKLFEYMASGRAVICSDLPALTGLIEDGLTGSVCPPEDPAALADSVNALLADPGRRTAIGDAARRAVARYSWENRVRALLSFLAGTESSPGTTP